MIIDLGKFVAAEQAYWKELETQLDQLDSKKGYSTLTLPQLERLHYLYQRAASDLARLATFSAEGDLRRSLGALVGRAYSEMHSSTGLRAQRDPYWLWRWLSGTFPRTFRRHAQAFAVVLALTMLGASFGAIAVAIDPEAKSVILHDIIMVLLPDTEQKKVYDADIEPNAAGSRSRSCTVVHRLQRSTASAGERRRVDDRAEGPRSPRAPHVRRGGRCRRRPPGARLPRASGCS